MRPRPVRALSTPLVLTTLALVLTGPSVSAQLPGQFHVQVGAGLALPSGDFAATDGAITDMPQTGFALEGIGYRLRGVFEFTPRVALLAELHQPRFTVDADMVRERLGVPESFEYDAHWEFKLTTIGVRVSPIDLVLAKPYLTAGAIRTKVRIVQTVNGTDVNMDSEVSTGMMYGIGALVPLGPVALDIEARMVNTEMAFEGQTLGWKASWAELGLAFSYRFGG